MIRESLDDEFDSMEPDEIRQTPEYQKAYDYADDMDWFVNGEDEVNEMSWWRLHDLASEAHWQTKLPVLALQLAMADVLSSMGYEVGD